MSPRHSMHRLYVKRTMVFLDTFFSNLIWTINAPMVKGIQNIKIFFVKMRIAMLKPRHKIYLLSWVSSDLKRK